MLYVSFLSLTCRIILCMPAQRTSLSLSVWIWPIMVAGSAGGKRCLLPHVCVCAVCLCFYQISNQCVNWWNQVVVALFCVTVAWSMSSSHCTTSHYCIKKAMCDINTYPGVMFWSFLRAQLHYRNRNLTEIHINLCFFSLLVSSLDGLLWLYPR